MSDNVIRGVFSSGPRLEPEPKRDETDVGWSLQDMLEANITITLGMYIKRFGYERTARLLASHLEKLESQIK